MRMRPLMLKPIRSLGLVTALLAAATLSGALIEEYKSGIVWPEPAVITPGPDNSPPSDAIILFDGQDMSQWEGGEDWEIIDGQAVARKDDVTSKRSFGDCQLHLEFATPAEVSGSGQGRGNSGVYLMGLYEVQILDSYGNATYFDGQCGAIYKQQPPMVNASRKPGEWQTYDIIFEAPKFNQEGEVEKPAYITVFHNGVVIHNHYELQGVTSYTDPPSYSQHAEKLPITLQFHGNPVRFRNIWLRENLEPLEGKLPETTREDDKATR